MHHYKIILISWLAVGLLSGCAQSFMGESTLEFRDIPYTSTQNKPWVEKKKALPGIAALYGLPESTQVHYVDLGPEDGQPIIFVHGLGSYLKFWRYQLDTFAASGYRVLALDMLGYGKSSKPATFPYTMESMAGVVHEFADAVGAQKPILVGHSMGGQTVLSYALQFPEDVRALVLTSPAGFEEFTSKEKDWFRSVFSTAFIKSADEEAIWGSIRRNNFARWKDEYIWLIEERVRLKESLDFDAYAYANVRSVHGLLDNEFVRNNLDKIKPPTIIVHGDWDRLIPNPFLHGGETVEIMSYGAKRIPDSKLVTLERCGHTVQMDCPDSYNQAVLTFLRARMQ
jgi:pimeloyl-ACP methyl ester carboxylesterase